MLKLKPDLGKTLERMEAFWEGSVLDRPVVQFYLAKPPEQQTPLPEAHHRSAEERWLDAEYQARLTFAELSNRYFLGDTLPVAFPNLGPDVMAAFYGCPLRFGDYGTSWSEPVLRDWSEAGRIVFDWNNPYFVKLVEIADAMLALGEGVYIVGMPDWHPGGDLLAALRDPQNLALDLIDNPEQVKALLDRLQPDYFALYDFWYGKLRAAGQPITSWLELAAEAKYYIPSNDFSALISTGMFREFFLPGIINECRFLERSIYHLDGPGALRHLDTILEIPELHAVQWVPGAGREGFSRWIPVYQRVQAAGKGAYVYCDVADLGLLMETLRPNGLALSISGIADREMAGRVLAALERWTLHPQHA